MECPVCGDQIRFAGHGMYSGSNASFKTSFFDCSSCDLLYRDVNKEQLKSHLAVASYVKQSNEPRFWKSRCGFFEYILKIIETHKNITKRIYQICKRVYGLLHLRDYGRVDLRLTPNNKIVILEVNANPDVAKGEELAEAAKKAGIPYKKFIEQIIHTTMAKK